MGSSSSSSNQQSTTYTTDTVNANLQNNSGFAVGAVKATKGGNINITTTDAGAIQQAAAVTMAAIQSASAQSAGALQFAQKVSQPDANTAKLQLAVIAVLGVAVIWSQSGRRKK